MVTAFIQRGAPLKELTVLQISNVKDGQPKLYICADEREGRRKGRERKGREGKGREGKGRVSALMVIKIMI